MFMSVENILANPNSYLNSYNDYSPQNAYYNYYAEYRNHAHSYEHDYEEKRAIELEKERLEREESEKSAYKKRSLEELDAQIRNIWEKEKMADRKPSQAMYFSTKIADYDKYVEVYKKEKEALGLKNCLTPLTRAEEEALREKERQTPRNIKLSSYDFIHRGFPDAGDNTFFLIEGVRFSKEEYEGCCSVIQQARSLLPNGSLDYLDHALIGLAYNVVNTYAEENLTWDQRTVISQSVAADFDTCILREQEVLISDGAYIDSNDKYHAVRSGTTGGMNISATNKEAIEALRSIFGGVDLRDQKAVDKAYGQYLSIVGITGSFRPNSRLLTRLSNAQSILKNAGKKVDYSV